MPDETSAPAARLYHLAWINDRTGETTFATSEPETHEAAEIIRSKMREPSATSTTRIVLLETPRPPARAAVGDHWRGADDKLRIVRAHEYRDGEHTYLVEYAREIRPGSVLYLLERVTPEELDAWIASEGGAP